MMHCLEAAGYFLKCERSVVINIDRAGSVNARQGLSIPTRIAWPSRAGTFCHLGAVAAEQSVQGLSSSAICFTVSGCLSDWSLLPEVHQ